MIYLKQGKKGVSLRGLQPEMAVVLTIVAEIYESEFEADTIVTCGTEGRHGKASKHYTGHALDFRTRHIDEDEREKLADAVKDCLGDEFDIVLHESHLHIEFDPKNAINL